MDGGIIGRDLSAASLQESWLVPRVSLGPVRILWPDQVDCVHQAARMRLAEDGFEVQSAEARDVLQAAGARVDQATQRVCIAPAVLDELVAMAPACFSLHARNPARNLPIGNGHIAFMAVAGTAQVSDLSGGHRVGSDDDRNRLLQLCQALPAVHGLGGALCAPADLAGPIDCLDGLARALMLTDKVVPVASAGAPAVENGQRMVCIAHGIPFDALEQRPLAYTEVSFSAPLRLDTAMADSLLQMAKHNQAVIVVPSRGSTEEEPACLEAALIQQNAEVLAGIALVQAARAGAPVVYGALSCTGDGAVGAPALGLSDRARMAIASGQMARHYNVPLRVCSVTRSHLPDAQGAYDSMMSLWVATLSGAGLVQQAIGGLDGGHTASVEKMVIDAEILRQLSGVMTPFNFNKDTTLSVDEHAFCPPLLSDSHHLESRQAAGAPDTVRQAAELVERLLTSSQTPSLPPERAEALLAYVAEHRGAAVTQS